MANEQQRLLIANEAARLMHEQGIRDFGLAKRKAADRLRVGVNSKNLPRNEEVEAALRDYQRLFDPQLGDRLQVLRETAAKLMQRLSEFRPALVGSVLKGTATDNCGVQLHLFADSPELLDLFFLERQISYDLQWKRVRVQGDGEVFRDMPAYCFEYAGCEIEALMFAGREQKLLPLSPVDAKPMRRARLMQLEALLQQ